MTDISTVILYIYAEVMMIEALVEVVRGEVDAKDVEGEGVRIGGQIVGDVRFADDQGMVASSEAGLQRTVNRLNDTAKKFDMKINVQKTKVMVVSKAGDKFVNITIDGQRVEQVSSFKYLGSNISEDGRCVNDIRCRIAMAKEAFNSRKVLLSKRWDKALKKRMIKVLIWPIVLYGCETWTLLQEDIDRLQALEMWLWRQLEGVRWEDHISNEIVLERVEETRGLMKAIWQRKKNWIGHVLRGNGLLRDVLEGSVEGAKIRGRPRMKMLDDLMEDIDKEVWVAERRKKRDSDKAEKDSKKKGRKGCEARISKVQENRYEVMKRMAEDRVGWRRWMPATCR